MCHYVTAVLPKGAPLAKLQPIAQAHGKQLMPLNSPSIEAQIGGKEFYFLATGGMCDCGTPLGALLRESQNDKSRDQSHQEKKLRRKGWSQAKISRALKQKKDHDAAVAESRAKTDHEVMQSWLDFIADLTAPGRASYVGLLLHWYNGSIEGDISLKGRTVVKGREVSAATLGAMQEDVIYEFRTGA